MTLGESERAQIVDCLNTAYHEAGHAVVAEVIGLLWTYVTIEPEGIVDAAGYVDIKHLWIRDRETNELILQDDRVIRRHIIMAWAGPLAQLKVNEDAHVLDFMGDLDSIQSKYSKHRRLIRSTPDLLRERASRLVERYWRAIDSVAWALLEETTLDREVVRQIIEGEERERRNERRRELYRQRKGGE
jgi:hypothetical protein